MDGTPSMDAEPEGPRTPQVEAPDRTPLNTVAVRGRSDGASRIVVKNVATDEAQVASMLPGGDFCVDVPLEEGATTTFNAYGVSDDGNISAPKEFEVTQDDTAPQPLEDSCTASNPDCLTEPEICDNGDEDDNCNGYADECDPSCNGCADDNLEPNDAPFSVPMITPGDYDDLWICPCRIDWYAFDVAADGTINVDVSFNTAEVDIDMKLYTVDAAEMRIEPPAASSTGTTGTESIDYTATAAGRYYLKIYAFPEAGQKAGTYNMSID